MKDQEDKAIVEAFIDGLTVPIDAVLVKKLEHIKKQFPTPEGLTEIEKCFWVAVNRVAIKHKDKILKG